MESVVVLLLVALIYAGVWLMRCRIVAWEAEMQRQLVLHEATGESIGEQVARLEIAMAPDVPDVP